MTIQQQCCTLQQARTFNKLGIIQGYSLLFWNTDEEKNKGTLMINNSPKDGYAASEDNTCFSAFTIAELSIMIGRGTKAAEKHWQWLLACVNSGYSGTIAYNPIVLADFVIAQIQEGSLTVEEINTRLMAG